MALEKIRKFLLQLCGWETLGQQHIGPQRGEPCPGKFFILDDEQRAEKIKIELGVVRQIVKHAGHGQICRPGPALVMQHFANGVLLAKIFLRHAGCQHDIVWLGKGRFGIAAPEWKAEDLEYTRIGKIEFFLGKVLLAVAQNALRTFAKAHRFEHFGIGIPQRRANRKRAVGGIKRALLLAPGLGDYPVNAICVLVELVIGQFVAHVQRNQQTAGHTDCQTA